MQFLADVTVRCDVCDGRRFQGARARRAAAGAERRRRSRHDDRRRRGVLRGRGEDRAPPRAAPRGRPRLHASRPADGDAVRRRGAAPQARRLPRDPSGVLARSAVPLRRADDGPPREGRRPAASRRCGVSSPAATRCSPSSITSAFSRRPTGSSSSGRAAATRAAASSPKDRPPRSEENPKSLTGRFLSGPRAPGAAQRTPPYNVTEIPVGSVFSRAQHPPNTGRVSRDRSGSGRRRARGRRRPAPRAVRGPVRVPELHAEEDGLEDLSVECVLQDRVGFVWVGTDDGLFRYDGSRFRKFGHRDGLPRLRIYQLHETVGRPALRRDRRRASRATRTSRFVVLDEKDGLGIFSIPHQGVASDASGTLYVGTDRGLYVGRGDRFQFDEEANARGQRTGQRGARRPERGRLLLARRPALPQGVGPHRRVRPARGGCRSTRRIDDIRTDGAGRLWVRTVKRLFVLAPGRAALRARRRGASGIERDRATGARRPGAGARPDRRRAWPRATRPVAADRAPRGASGRHGARGDRGSRGLALGRACSAEASRGGSGHGQITNWSTADGLSHDVVWVDHATEGAVGPGADLGRHGAGAQPHRSGDRRDPHLLREPTASRATSSMRSPSAEDGGVWAGSWPGGVTHISPDGRLRRLGAEDATAGTVPRGGHPRAPRRGGLGRRRQRPLPSARRLPLPTGSSASRSAATSPTTCGASRRTRPGSSTPPASRGSSGSTVPRPAASPSATACARTSCPRSRSRPTAAS